MSKIRLIKLQCIVNDEIDKDEVFLKHNGKKIWPTSGTYTSMDNDEAFELELTLEHEDPTVPIVIELWDFDYLSRNDFLGNFEMILGKDTHGTFSTSMKLMEKNSTASYILHWEILS